MAVDKYLAEMVGTFILVVVGSMGILAAGAAGTLLVTVPFAFGLGFLAATYSVGHVSGGHFNPAVTLAMFLDKRTSATDLIGYWVGQFVGGLLGSLVLALAISRAAVSQTVTSYPAIGLGIVAELILTMIFVLVFLSSTRTAPAAAGFVIPLTLAAVHFAGIPFSGASVNPARSFASAVVGATFTGLWVYIVFPLLGAVAAWGIWVFFAPKPEVVESVVVAVAVEETIDPEIDI